MQNISVRRWLAPAALILLATTFWIAMVLAQDPPARKGPPSTRTENVRDSYFGTEVVDPYRWLEDQQSPETRAWIDAQNAYTRAVLDTLPGREKLKRRLTELLSVDAFQVPVERNGRYFFAKRAAGQDQFALYLRKGRSAGDEVLVDPEPLSSDHSVSVERQAVSHDGKLLVYGVRQGGEDQIVPHFFDVDARKTLTRRTTTSSQGQSIQQCCCIAGTLTHELLRCTPARWPRYCRTPPGRDVRFCFAMISRQDTHPSSQLASRWRRLPTS